MSAGLRADGRRAAPSCAPGAAFLQRAGQPRATCARAVALRAAVLLALAWALLLQPAWAATAQELARITALEQEGRSKPAQAFEGLDALAAQLPEGDPALLDVLRIQGRLAATQSQPEALERILGRLAQWAGTAGRSAQAKAEVTALSRCLRADLLRFTGPLSQADAMYDEVLPSLLPQTSANTRLGCLMGSAAAKESLGHFDAAVSLYQEAIRLADAASMQVHRARMRTGLANVLKRAGQVEQGFVVNAEARRIAEQSGDWLSMSESLTVHAILLNGMGRDEEELQTLKQAIDFARRAGAVEDEGLGLGNLADYYLQRGDHAQALALAQQALPLSRQARDAVGIKLALANSGLALIAMHRKDEGLRLVRESIEDDRRSDEIVSMAETLLELGRYLEQAGYHADAYATYGEYRAVFDEVSLRTRQHAVLELQESFEADRRRRDRALLNDDNQLKEEQLRRESLQFRLWVLVAALAAVLLLLAVLLYRRLRATQTELRDAHDHLKAQSEQDPLTGLANRRHGQATMALQPWAQGTLYLLDLDHFKRINDRFGHACGDVVLVEVARRLKAVVREGDSVIRWGGEEFLIFVRSGPIEQADLMAQRLLAALASLPVLVETRHIAVSASIGYAEFPLMPHRLDVPWDIALDLVDAAMYLAKTRGRNRACGLRHVPAQDAAGLHRLMQDVEAAWRDGRLMMSEWIGPERVGESA